MKVLELPPRLEPNAQLFRPYPVVVRFRRLHLRGFCEGLVLDGVIHHTSEERAQKWIEGCRKNCTDWQFVGEPEIGANLHYQGY